MPPVIRARPHSHSVDTFTPRPEPSLPPATFPLLSGLGWAWAGLGMGRAGGGDFPGLPMCPGHRSVFSSLLPPSLLNPSPSLSDTWDPRQGLCGVPKPHPGLIPLPPLDKAEPPPVYRSSCPIPTLVQLLQSFLHGIFSKHLLWAGISLGTGATWWAKSHSLSLASWTSFSVGSWRETIR